MINYCLFIYYEGMWVILKKDIKWKLKREEGSEGSL